MLDMTGNEVNVGDRVLHVQKGSTSVYVQIGIVTSLKERTGSGWAMVPDSVKICREWTNGFKPLDIETPWLYARNVIKI